MTYILQKTWHIISLRVFVWPNYAMKVQKIGWRNTLMVSISRALISSDL